MSLWAGRLGRAVALVALASAWSWLVACGSSVLVGAGTPSPRGGAGGAGGVGGAAGGDFDPFGSGGAAPTCSDSQLCGGIFEQPGCLRCEIDLGRCDSEYAACVGQPECAQYEACLLGCADSGCVAQCGDSYPSGAQAYSSLRECILCGGDSMACLVACKYSCTLADAAGVRSLVCGAGAAGVDEWCGVPLRG